METPKTAKRQTEETRQKNSYFVIFVALLFLLDGTCSPESSQFTSLVHQQRKPLFDTLESELGDKWMKKDIIQFIIASKSMTPGERMNEVVM